VRRRFESCRGRQPVLRGHRRRDLVGGAAAIAEDDCDTEGTVGRLVDDLELQRIEQRTWVARGRWLESGSLAFWDIRRFWPYRDIDCRRCGKEGGCPKEARRMCTGRAGPGRRCLAAPAKS
jgi:hypothetical protein